MDQLIDQISINNSFGFSKKFQCIRQPGSRGKQFEKPLFSNAWAVESASGGGKHAREGEMPPAFVPSTF